ncbi:hypothetical protein BJY24_001894 [Nocardia transvalensis]|uniref:Uncharacterized protein n=1 Tax=Nocardia transvalensis TaxID=37333 RepID=A0A7W9PBG2_9NOCA|nr:hypothetical protein [Nocardia transvalensis]MBB5913027.1 hypothetical protein [Nocardia transvalensis]
MKVLSVAEIDSELSTRGREVDAITSTLLELDKHPGLTLLRGYPPAGRTAERWEAVRRLLDLMWEDYGRLQSILEQARTIRGRRQRPGDADRAEITRLLRDRPHEVSRTPIPLAERSLTGHSERVLFVGIADTVDRMRTTFPEILEFLDAVDAVNTRVLAGLSPIQARLDHLGGVTAELRSLAAEVRALLSRSATDPLALESDIASVLDALAERLRRESEALTEVLALSADWPVAVARTRERIEELREARDRAADARIEAEAKIVTAPLPVRPDDLAALRAELAGLSANPPVAESTSAPTPAALALLELRRRLDTAAADAAADERLARGLLERRAELRGRLSAYQAKAARLGVSEHPDVLSSGRIATGLLSRRPCDLAAVTRAVADFQQVVAETSGRRE